MSSMTEEDYKLKEDVRVSKSHGIELLAIQLFNDDRADHLATGGERVLSWRYQPLALRNWYRRYAQHLARENRITYPGAGWSVKQSPEPNKDGSIPERDRTDSFIGSYEEGQMLDAMPAPLVATATYMFHAGRWPGKK